MSAASNPARGSGLGTNQEAVRRHNLGTVLRHVHGVGTLSRAELTATMGLNRSTIAGLVSELESLGLTERVESVGAGNGARAGRPSAGVRLCDTGPYVVAVDLGVDRVMVAAVGLGGRVLARSRTPFDGGREPWQVGSVVATLIRRVVAEVEEVVGCSRLVGIGVGVPGLVRRSDGLIRLAPNLDWRDVSFASILLAALGVDIAVSVDNDANLGALAEHRRGAGLGFDDVIYVSGNVGVGAGVVAGGMPLIGAGGYAGEVGHLRMSRSGTRCHCGNLGCWETEVGARAIASAIGWPVEQAAQLEDRLEELLLRIDTPPPELRATGQALARGLASLVNTFNPQLMVLGGYLAPLYTLLRAEVDATLAEEALPAPQDAVSLTVPGLGVDAILLGAAEVAFEPLFADPVASLGSALTDIGARLAG